MIIKRVCKCDIDLIQQFIKQEVNIKWLILSDYNTIESIKLMIQW